MLRIFFGGLIGFIIGLLTIIGWGVCDGFTAGLPTANLQPGIEAALKSAFVYTMYLWPIALALGGGGGSLCGFGTWLVKPSTPLSKMG